MLQAVDWQLLTALLLVAAAAISVLLRVRRLFSGGSSGCGTGGCGSCPSNQQAGESSEGRSLPLVSLDAEPRRTSH